MDPTLDLVVDALLDALIDSAKMLPLLFVIYVAIEVLEVKLGDRMGRAMARAGAAGPVVGAVAGIIPQCGVSVVAAALYTQRLATVGTLFAVLIATSDEAIPVILSHPEASSALVPLIATKLLAAIVVGYGLDLVFRSRNKRLLEQGLATAEAEHLGAPVRADAPAPKTAGTGGLVWSTDPEDPVLWQSVPTYTCGCGDPSCTAAGPRRLDRRTVLLLPLKHTLQVFVFIFLTSLVIALAFAFVGQDAIAAALADRTVLQPVLAALVGLIPNCAASVAVTEFYLNGVITFGAAIAGLSAGGGLGVLVLVKEGRPAEAAAIVAGLLAISVATGLVVQACGIA